MNSLSGKPNIQYKGYKGKNKNNVSVTDLPLMIG